ncbi:glycosyltransferase family 4 protein [Candidatus Woesearchaeota archaeon]|nr:glycosyltransferase family 4 protein [Candidatus Woesearchaeota archaeon]
MKPKLLLVADTYYPKVDGTLRFMEEFLKRSGDQFDISLLVPDLGVHKGKKVSYVQPSKILQVSGYPSLKLSWSNIQKIKQTIQQNDLIFVQGPALMSYLSIYYGAKYHKKTFFYTHTLAWELFEKFFPPILKKLFFTLIKKASIWFYNQCDEIFVPYHELKEHLASEGVRTKMTVARLGVDIDLFSPSKNKAESKRKLGIHSDVKVIGYVGRISKEKNMAILLSAFKRLRYKNLLFLLVGDGPEDQVEKFRQLPNCRITGFVSNVQDYVPAMDVFIMPSLTETTSLATLEAMSCSVPVIVTKVGFVKKYVVKEYNGLFFPRHSASALAGQMERLLEDKNLREKLGANGRKTVAYSFSWDRSINKIRRLLLEW